MLIVFTVYMVGVAMLTLAERKISAWIQDRHGPNRVGPSGLLQPAADGVKNIMKEETYPDGANMPLFILAPALSFIPALITCAVIPFGAPAADARGAASPLRGRRSARSGSCSCIAISSLGVYGIVLAGWSSNNKYALLGGLRSSAQMISYEIAMGMSLVPVLLLVGQRLAQRDHPAAADDGLELLPAARSAFFIFLVAGFAETNRLPFDLPEAESELIAGYHTEYSAMKFSLFFIAEYANMVTVVRADGHAVLRRLGHPVHAVGQHAAVDRAQDASRRWRSSRARWCSSCSSFMWIRWTLPRFRYDQLMSLGWKFLLPLALGVHHDHRDAILALDALESTGSAASGVLYQLGISPFWGIMGVLNVLMAICVFFVLDRGRIVSPAYSRIVHAPTRARCAR